MHSVSRLKSYKSAILGMFRLSRGYLLAVLYLLPSFLMGYGYFKIYMKADKLIDKWRLYKFLKVQIDNTILCFNKTFIHVCFNKGFVLYRCILVDHKVYPVGTSLDIMVGLAWLCEKMKANIKISLPTCTIWRHFEKQCFN